VAGGELICSLLQHGEKAGRKVLSVFVICIIWNRANIQNGIEDKPANIALPQEDIPPLDPSSSVGSVEPIVQNHRLIGYEKIRPQI
jgi:hypothetical protein